MPDDIHDVLVANRGEIAIRIFRACTELGIDTTAIYSWEDRLSLHRYKADRAYQVGDEGEPVAAYLNGDEILRLAARKGVDAIHPGYGFLSENAEFAQKVVDSEITWIGPQPEAMRELGDKVSARRVAEKANVPVVPGSGGSLTEVDRAREAADEIGYPVLIKSSHGGGGRGMRAVEAPSEFADAFQSAQSEAMAAFGSDEVFLERYVDKPRHIEVQLLGDKHGNRVHFHERDCSVQRRLQKIVELAPAPNLDESIREQLYEYAIDLADVVDYQSAGTAEFLVEERDDETNIYFIEVNTRIQVEHTVTEMITGYDLIKSMIRVAEGYELDGPELEITGQDDIERRGQAIQCRITTEDPENDFAPDSGKIINYRSGAGFGIRLDGSVGGTNAVIEPHFDSLLVKVSAWGRDLPDAIPRLQRALAEFRVRGVETNIPFLRNVIRHEKFVRGETHTRFVDETPELFVYPEKRDRGTKALRAIGDITINGPPGTDEQYERPDPLLVPDPEQPDPDVEPPISPAYRVFDQEGPEALSDWIRDHRKLLVTDTTFRDAHQSLLATRVRTQDITDIAPQTAHRLPGMFSYEMWGGATFDVCMRFLKEDPWERLRRIREAMPGALLQMLLRGANAVGYTNYPDNVVRSFVQEAAQTGIDVFRIFDALNYVPNMELAIEEVRNQGKIAEASICYTGDVLDTDEDKYTVDYYTDLAERLEERGAHILNIKDMAGLLKPYSAKVLVEALKDATELPIHLHTHDTSGNGVAMYLMAAEAGVDIIDGALSSMAGLTSQPSTNAVVTAMEGRERQPELPVDELQQLTEHWEKLRTLYYPFESGLKASTTDVYFHEIPGGQYSNLRPRAIQLGMGDQWDRIKRTYHEVDQALGRLIKVTPTSKVVADLAMFLVRNDMTVDDIFEMHGRGEEVDFPQSVIDFFKGRLGEPYGGYPEDLQEIVLKGDEPIRERPGALMEDYDWDDAREELEALGEDDPDRQDLISYALYPKVFSDLVTSLDEFGEYRILDTVSFLYGMEVGEETLVEIEEGKTLVIKLLAVGELRDDGTRLIYFELNGQPREVVVRDESVELESTARPKADPTEPGEVAASMQGTVLEVHVDPGDTVEQGEVIITTEAMKMETNITAPLDGEVTSIEVRPDDDVDSGDLVATIE